MKEMDISQAFGKCKTIEKVAEEEANNYFERENLNTLVKDADIDFENGIVINFTTLNTAGMDTIAIDLNVDSVLNEKVEHIRALIKSRIEANLNGN